MTFREELITPDIAREYLKANKINRPLNSATVLYYATLMRQGKWMMNGEAICFLKDGALGNGQHRLAAVIKADVPVRFLVVRGCDDRSFVTYDSGKNRSTSDVLALAGIPNSHSVGGIISRYFTLRAGTYGLARSNSSAKELKKSKQDFIDEYNSSPDLYMESLVYARKHVTRRMPILKGAEVGALYVFLIKERLHTTAVVKRFIDGLFDLTDSTEPLRLLRERLISDKMSKTSMKSEYKYNLIAKAWNAYIANKPMKQLRWMPSEGKIYFR